MGHRLLIVDDEEGIVVTMKEYFETYGHQVDVARGREEAESFLDAGSYSLMIADLRLHPIREADGLDLLALVREPQALSDVARVVFALLASPA